VLVQWEKACIKGLPIQTSPGIMKKSKDHAEAEDDARLERVAELLEKLAVELCLLKKTERTKMAAPEKSTESPSAREGPWDMQKGVRVRVVRKDQYLNRTGVVIRWHGCMFWDVQLDATETRCACLIYKKDASLCVIRPE
jgi:hypothetical protein